MSSAYIFHFFKFVKIVNTLFYFGFNKAFVYYRMQDNSFQIQLIVIYDINH